MAQTRSAFIAGLRRQRDALDRAIKALVELDEVEQLYGMPAMLPLEEAPVHSSPERGLLRELPSAEPVTTEKPDPWGLRKMRLSDAIITIMQKMGTPLTNQQIAEILQAADYPSSSINMPNNVGTALNRVRGLKVERVGNTWVMRDER